MTQPGARLLRIARRVVDHRTIARLIEPAIADLRHEYRDASLQSGPWPRRRALGRGYVSLLRLTSAVALGCADRIASGFASDDDGLLGRLLTVTAVAVAFLTAILTLPVDRGRVGNTPLILALLIPQALGVALPLGWLAGTLVALRKRPTLRSRVARVRLMAVALAVCLCTLVTTAWLVPAANQRFREVMATALAVRDGQATPVYLAPGPAEMTFSELSRQIALMQTSSAQSSEAKRLRFTYHIRLALAAWPLVLLVLAMGVSVAGRGRWWAIVLTMVANPLSAMVIWGGVPFESAPILQAWLPLFTMAVVGATLLLVAGRQRESGVDGVLRGS